MKILSTIIGLLFASTAFAATPPLQVFQGGTGSSTLTGILIGNGTSSVQSLIIGSNLTLTGTTLSGAGGGGSFPFTSASYGVSTSTIVGFLAGMFSVGSSTIQDLHATNFTLGTLSGGLGANNGVVYAGATTTAGTGLSYSNGQFINDGVTSISATAPLVNNLSTGAVSLTCPTCSIFSFTPFPLWNATGTLLSLTGGVMSTASSTLQNLHTNTLTMEDSASAYGVAIGFTNTTMAGNQTLTIDTGNYSPTLTFQGAAGNPTLGDWFNQSVKTTASPTFAGLTLTGLSGGLGVNTGVVYAAATTTFSTGLTYAAGAVTCDTATASVFGCLGTGNFSTFNNKVSSTSLSGVSIISYTSGTGVITTTGGTFGSGDYVFPSKVTAPQLAFTNATGTSIYASASSTLQNLSVGSTTVALTAVFNGKVGHKLASSTGATAYTVDWDSANSQKFLLSANSTFDINATSSHPIDGFYSVKICNRATVYTFTYQGSGAYVKPISGQATSSIPSTANTCLNILYQWDTAQQFYSTLASTTSQL